MGWAGGVGGGVEGGGGRLRMAATAAESNVGGEWAYRGDAYYIKAVGISRSVCSLCDGKGEKDVFPLTRYVRGPQKTSRRTPLLLLVLVPPGRSAVLAQY